MLTDQFAYLSGSGNAANTWHAVVEQYELVHVCLALLDQLNAFLYKFDSLLSVVGNITFHVVRLK